MSKKTDCAIEGCKNESSDEVAHLASHVNDLIAQHKSDIEDLTNRIDDLENAVASLSKNDKVESKFDENKASAFLKIVADTKLKPSSKRAALQYLEYHATKVVEMKEWVSLPAATLITFMKSDVLRVKEITLLEAVVRWGKAEIKRQDNTKLDASKDEDVASVLVNVLPYVRVHTMKIQDIISQKDLLSAAFGMSKVLQLFTYIGLSNEKRLEMASQFTDFTAKPRKGAVAPLTWTNVNTSYCTLSNENKTISATCYSSWNCNAIGSKPECIDDVYSYKLTIVSGGGNLMIGFAPSTMSLTSSTYSSCGWYLYQSGGGLYSQAGDSSRAYASSFSVGATIICKYNPSKSTISFTINGTDKGTAFNNVSGDLYPAINFYEAASVTIGPVDE